MPARSAISSKTAAVKASKKSNSPISEPKAKAKSVTFHKGSSDGATEEQAAKTQAPTSVQPVEPEDSYLTGVSRSLQRRLLGLNISQAKPIPGAQSPGIHSTGSYTDGRGVKPEKLPKISKNNKKR